MTNNLEKLETLINKVTDILEDVKNLKQIYEDWSRQLADLKAGRLDIDVVQYFELKENVRVSTGGNEHPDTIDLLVMLNLNTKSLMFIPASLSIDGQLGTSLIRIAYVRVNNIKLNDADLSLEMVCEYVSQLEKAFKSNCLQLETEINQAKDVSDVITYLWENDVNEMFPSKDYFSFLDDIIAKHPEWNFKESWLYILNPTMASLNSLLSEFCLVTEQDISMHSGRKFTKINLTDTLNFFNQYRLLDWLDGQKKKYPHIFEDYSDELLVANFYENFWSLLLNIREDSHLGNHNITKTGWLNLKDFRELMSKENSVTGGLHLFNRFIEQFNPAQLSKRICSQNVLSMINIDDDEIVNELNDTALCSNIRITMKQFNKLMIEKPEAITYNYLIIDDITTKEFNNVITTMNDLNHSLYRLLRVKFQAGEIKVQSSNDAAQQISLL